LKDEWKRHIRELKILRAKKQSGGWLPLEEAKRLEWLEQRFGDAPEIERIQIDEPVNAGPKTTTADHGYATEVSEKLLEDADKYKLTKAWEQDQKKDKRGFEARDHREGQATFKQEGLSGFAVEATEDLQTGEIGLAKVPEEEEKAEKKIEHGQVVYAQDESERLTKQSRGANPFALEIADSLSRGLDQHTEDKQDTVPDTAAKSYAVEMDDEELQARDNLDRAPAQANDLSNDLQGLLKKSYDLPKENRRSEGEKSTHALGDAGEDSSTLDLMRQAIDYAEAQETTEEEAQVFEIDEEGNALPNEEQVEDLSVARNNTGTEETAEAELPQPPSYKKKLRFSDTAPTRPDVAVSEPATKLGAAPEAPVPETQKPDAQEPEDLAVLIPDATYDLPDKNEILKIDTDDIMELPVEVEMEIDHGSPAKVAAAGDIDTDQFWGLSEEATAESPPAPPSAPKHRPKKPLPTLSVAPAPPPREKRPAPRPVDRKSTDAWLNDTEIETGGDDDITPIAPAKPRATAAFAERITQLIDISPGPRKATVHFKDGVTRRGVIGNFDIGADLIHLDPPAGSSAPAEDLVALALKTIFLMLPRGADKPRVNGSSVRLVLIDGRSLEGVTTDYDPQERAFTLFPKGTRGNIERIIVYNDAVKNIWFD
jgi:hypothetical protein